MKPLLSAIMTENQHHRGGMASFGFLPAVADGVCTLEMGGSPFSFLHPRDWGKGEKTHLWNWTDVLNPGWFAAWMRDNGLAEWFDNTPIPEGAQAVWLHGDCEAWAVTSDWLTGGTTQAPEYNPAAMHALPLIYTAIQVMASTAWDVPVLVGHTNHVRAAPFAGAGPYLTTQQHAAPSLLAKRMKPLGAFVPIKAFWKHESKHAGWSVEQCREHVNRTITAAMSVADGLPLVLNIGAMGHDDERLIRPEELAGSILAVEGSLSAVGSRLWASTDRLASKLGNAWEGQLGELVGQARELVAERVPGANA